MVPSAVPLPTARKRLYPTVPVLAALVIAFASWPLYRRLLVAVDGNYDDVNRLCSELVGDPLTSTWGFVNVNLRPYYAEGSKSLGYEVAEQLGMDPIELRIRNEPEGTVPANATQRISDRNLVRCLREGAERFGWAQRSARPAGVT